MKFFIETYGCQMNVHDSERMAGLLEQSGYEAAPDAADADVVVVNTCSVRERAEDKLYTRLGEIRQASEESGRAPVVAVGGCVAQQEAGALLKRSKIIDVIVGTQSLKQLPVLVDQAIADASDVARIDVDAYEDVSFPLGVARRHDPVKAYVTIIEGCNEFCSFCVVPYTRGHERMRPKRDIVAEVIQAAGEGHREIQLLGQIVNHYQAPDDPSCDFAALLEAVHDVPASSGFDLPARIRAMCRLVSFRPFAICRRCASTSICRCSRARRACSRPCAAATRARAISSSWPCCAQTVPGITLSTDMIVGFPGETDTEFEETLSLTRLVRYESMFSFKYSERPNTLALKRLPDDVSEDEKTRRIVALQALQREVQLELHQAVIGETFDVLVDSVSRRREWELSGRTSGNTVVNFPGPKEWLGRTVPVRITRAGAFSIGGEAITS